MSIQRIQVESPDGLDSAIIGYLNQGFTVAARTENKATLQKNKPPLSTAMIIIGLIIPLFGWAFLIGYLILHASKPASQIVEILVSDRESTR